MKLLNRTAVVVVPQQPFFDWLARVDPDIGALTLADVQEEPTVYLLAECADDAELRRRLRWACRRIFEMELAGWMADALVWPEDRGFAEFSRWFSWSGHSEIVDLERGNLVREEV